MSDDARHRWVWKPRWWRWLGVESRDGSSYRCTWGEMSTRRSGPSIQLIRRELKWTVHLGLWLIAFYVRLPWRALERSGEDFAGDSWGFTFSDSYLHLNWREKSKLIELPWSWGASVGCWALTVDGSGWYPAPVSRIWRDGVTRLDSGEDDYEPRLDPNAPDSLLFTEPVRYRLSSGEWQERTATVSVHRQEWRMVRWLPFPRRIWQGISVTFSDEVGERTGSWKGGTIGCGYELLPNESPYGCLERMMRERKFK